MSGRYLSEWLFDWNVMRRGDFSQSGAMILHLRAGDLALFKARKTFHVLLLAILII